MASFPGFKYRKQILMNNTNRTSTKNIQYSTLFLNVALILKANTDNGIFDETLLSQNITADIYICRPGRLNTIDYNNPGLGFFLGTQNRFQRLHPRVQQTTESNSKP